MQRFIEERGEDYIKNLERTAPTAAKVEREYRQALDDMREYRELNQISGLSADEVETATEFERKLTDLARSLPPDARSSRLTFLMAASEDPESAAVYRMYDRFKKTPAGKRLQKMRQQYWAEHPLLSKYFSDAIIVEPETTTAMGQGSAFDFENYEQTVR